MVEDIDTEAVARRGVDAWNANDWEAMEANAAPDIVVVAPEGWPESGEFVGWDAARRQFERLKEPLADEHAEILGTETSRDKALTHVRWTGKGEGSGIDFDMELWMVATVRNGKQTRLEYFLDEADARRSAGIEAAA